MVLTEVLTGDHRRDFHTNQLLRMCQVREVSEQRARDAGRMRTRTGRVATISATDAVVAALAARSAPALVLTSDPDDLRVLVRDSLRPVDVARV